MTESALLEYLLKRDRYIVMFGLAAVTALSWVYLFVVAENMSGMPMSPSMGGSMAMAQHTSWNAVDYLMMFLMWAVMMVGMMLPSASPMILLFSLVTRKQKEQGRIFAPVGAFASGYLIVWTGFSVAASTLQGLLERAELVNSMMVSVSPYLGGALLIVAGVYQLTPLKTACLKHCRSPFMFFAHHWRPGRLGGLRMGIRHGAFCVGCCWALMALLFVGGVMNLLWVAIIALFVLLEKVIPAGQGLGRMTGVGLLASGVWFVVAPLL